MAYCDIVIPFYQRKPGVLRRAVQSVRSQSVSDWRLIIVDDGSPQPADEDLAGFEEVASGKIALVHQANKGVSGARNTGLEHVSPDASMVAFLDSDDEWTPDHLKRVMDAGQAGADLYWEAVAVSDGAGFDSDSKPGDVIPPDLIESAGLPSDWARRPTSLYSVLIGQWWRHMHLSCTAVSARVAQTVRFRESLSFCEDFAFFMDCAALSELTLFSDEVGVVRGTGDNVWHNVGFDDPRIADEKFNMFRLLTEMRRTASLSPSDLELLDLRRQVCRELFYWNQNHRIKAGHSPSWKHWAIWMSQDAKLLKFVAGLALGTNQNNGKTVIPGEPG